MYQSPIELIKAGPFIETLKTETDEMIFRAVAHADVQVDRDELIKALNYDREQYQKGFHDGVMHERRNDPIIVSALHYYIQHLKNEIAEMLDHGESIGFLQDYVEQAEEALSKLSA